LFLTKMILSLNGAGCDELAGHQCPFFMLMFLRENSGRNRGSLSKSPLDHLVAWIGPELARPNQSGLPLSPRQRIQVDLHFIGCNGFYHDVAGSHVISKQTIGNSVREVCNVMFQYRNEVIIRPKDYRKLAADFFDIEKNSMCRGDH
jgi:hypothetical protein